MCDSYEGCSVLVRFDNETPEHYPALTPKDRSTTILFIQNYDKFVQKTVKAKTVFVQIPIYQNGNQTLEFNVAGLNLNKFDPNPTQNHKKPIATNNVPLVSSRLTITDGDTLRRQIEQCWNPSASVRDAQNLTVETIIKVNPDRTVANTEIVDKERYRRDSQNVVSYVFRRQTD